MKLFNALVHYEAWILAHTSDGARIALESLIRGGEVKPFEAVAFEIRNERDIPARIKEELPFVANEVPPSEYEPTADDTVIVIWKRLYTKEAPP